MNLSSPLHLFPPSVAERKETPQKNRTNVWNAVAWWSRKGPRSGWSPGSGNEVALAHREMVELWGPRRNEFSTTATWVGRGPRSWVSSSAPFAWCREGRNLLDSHAQRLQTVYSK